MAWRSIEATAFLFILLAPDVSAQRVAGNVLTGVRTFSDGTGMFVIEVRGDIQPKGWPVRPAVGFASASDLFWTQTEFTVGARAEGRAWARFVYSGGVGLSWMSQDGGALASGSSVGPYLNAAVQYALNEKLRVGLDVRILTGSSFVRADGLVQDLNFSQYGMVMTWRTGVLGAARSQ